MTTKTRLEVEMKNQYTFWRHDLYDECNPIVHHYYNEMEAKGRVDAMIKALYELGGILEEKKNLRELGIALAIKLGLCAITELELCEQNYVENREYHKGYGVKLLKLSEDLTDTINVYSKEEDVNYD